MGVRFVPSLAKLMGGTSSFPAHQPQKCFRDVRMERFGMLAPFSPRSPQSFNQIFKDLWSPSVKCGESWSETRVQCRISHWAHLPPNFTLGLDLESCLERFCSELNHSKQLQGFFSPKYLLWFLRLILQTPSKLSNVLTKASIHSKSVSLCSSSLLIPN